MHFVSYHTVLISVFILITHHSFNGFATLGNYFGKWLHVSHTQGCDPTPVGF